LARETATTGGVQKQVLKKYTKSDATPLAWSEAVFQRLFPLGLQAVGNLSV
jgi:hypothetical protein